MTPILACKAVARQFGDLIAKEDYLAAHSLLTKGAQKNFSPDDFKQTVVEMTSYAPGPIEQVEVMDDILEEWPAKEDLDVANVYVALTGDGFCETAYLTIANEGVDYRIREIEWGRP